MGHGVEDKVCNWWGGSRTSLERVNGPNLMMTKRLWLLEWVRDLICKGWNHIQDNSYKWGYNSLYSSCARRY